MKIPFHILTQAAVVSHIDEEHFRDEKKQIPLVQHILTLFAFTLMEEYIKGSHSLLLVKAIFCKQFKIETTVNVGSSDLCTVTHVGRLCTAADTFGYN